MNYEECIELIDWLNNRFQRAGMKPWYRWAIDITWDKLLKWRQLLEKENERSN